MTNLLNILTALGSPRDLRPDLIGTPGINPNAPDPRGQYGGIPMPPGSPMTPPTNPNVNPATQQRKQEEQKSLLSPILSRLGPIGRGIDSFGGELAGAARNSLLSGSLGALAPRTTQSVLGADQNRRQNDLSEMQQQLIRSRIQALRTGSTETPFGRINPSDFTPESLAKFQQSQNFGDLTPRSDSGVSPSAVREYEFFQSLGDPQDPDRLTDAQKRYLAVKRGGTVKDVPGIGAIDPTTREVLSPEEDVSEALAGRGAALKQSGQDVDLAKTLPTEIARIDQQIERANDFIKALEDGRLDTGPFQRFTSKFTPIGQDFQSFSGEDVIRLIGSATFGSLSEPERKFIESTTFGLGKDEQINKQDLRRLVEILEKSRAIKAQDLERIGGKETDDFEGFSIVDG